MSERRPGGDARDYLESIVGMALFVVGGIGFTVVNLRDAALNESIERWRLILGVLVIFFAAAFLAFFLLSRWAYGALKTIRRERPEAIAVRSGASPALRKLLDDSSVLRRQLARTRPPFMQFLLVFDPEGIEIWHGSGQGGLTGSLAGASIERVSPGATHDGVWPFATIDVFVTSSDGAHRIPFVVRGPSGFVSARKSDVDRIARTIEELYVLTG